MKKVFVMAAAIMVLFASCRNKRTVNNDRDISDELYEYVMETVNVLDTVRMEYAQSEFGIEDSKTADVDRGDSIWEEFKSLMQERKCIDALDMAQENRATLEYVSMPWTWTSYVFNQHVMFPMIEELEGGDSAWVNALKWLELDEMRAEMIFSSGSDNDNDVLLAILKDQVTGYLRTKEYSKALERTKLEEEVIRAIKMVEPDVVLMMYINRSAAYKCLGMRDSAIIAREIGKEFLEDFRPNIHIDESIINAWLEMDL